MESKFGLRRNQKAERLAAIFSDNRLKVLFLGSRTGDFAFVGSTILVGLLLYRNDLDEPPHYRRLGFC